MKAINKFHAHNDLLTISFIYHKFQFSKFHIYFIVRILHAASRIEIAYQEDQLKNEIKISIEFYNRTCYIYSYYNKYWQCNTRVSVETVFG